MHFLAIDPSLNCGWALLKAGTNVPVLGTWKLKTPLEIKNKARVRQGLYFVRFWKSITQLRKDHGIEDQPLQIAIEGQSFGSIGTEESQDLADGWKTLARFYCETKGLDEPLFVPPMSWKNAKTGIGPVPSELRTDRRDTDKIRREKSVARQKWAKEQSLQNCRKRGLSPSNDNEADAFGILLFVVNGGGSTLIQKKADKKAKTAAKKGQARLNFGGPAK
jgi:hypothetical protein